MLWALLFIAAGIFLLLSNYGVIVYRFDFSKDWPALLIIFGSAALLRACRIKKKKYVNIDVGKTGREYCKQVLDELERGEISAEEAEKRLKDV
jgi:hypothetical protein